VSHKRAEGKQLVKEAEKEVAEQTLDGRAGEILEDSDALPQSQDGKDKVRESLRINTTTPAIR